MTLFSICIILGTMCVDLLSATSVAGHVGSTAVLPCKLQGEVSENPYIRWFINSETVFERRGGDKYEAQGYQGRVDVSEVELRMGNCSLLLYNLRINDSDVYTSYEVVTSSKTSDGSKMSLNLKVISTVELLVSVKSPEEKSTSQKMHVPKGDAGTTGRHPQIVLSLVSFILSVLW